MERAGQQVDAARATSHSRSNVVHSKHDKPRSALILYGSETGNAQDVAEEVGRMAERLRFDTTVLDMDSVQLRDILKPTVVIFAISTTGQGEMPQNARQFWKTLLSGALKSGVLRKVRFSSFGLGDSSYARFNVSHRMLHGRLLQLGAQAFCERGEGNEQHPEGHSAGFREWIVNLKQKLLDAFPLSDGVEPIPDDVFLEPKWKLAMLDRPDITNTTSPSYETTAPTTHDVPSTTLMPVKGAYTAHIAANDRITSPDHFQDVRLMDLHLTEEYSYGPGAVAVVYPKNFPNDIDDFIHLMNWQTIADKPLQLTSSSKSTSNHPSPLRHLNLPAINPLTLRYLLENVLDIMSIPRRTFFASLIHYTNTKNPTEDETYQRDRLLELADPNLIDELWDYTTRPKRTILEVMMDFTTVKIPWEFVLAVVPMMKGRQFSIASGGELKRVGGEGEGVGGADGRGTRVQLLVAIADPPSPIIKWRRRYGVCTRYIASLQAGQRISIGMQEGYLDVRSQELEIPVVMIGPGTGVAPMRALIWQRLQWARELGSKPAGGRLEGDILFFGCRNAEGDYFFREEWERLERQEALTVLTAFSREVGRERVYVQDRIRECGGLVRRAVLEGMGKVYLCGSSGNMPKGVKEALLDVLGAEERLGGLGSREEAEAYFEGMEKVGRFKQETW